MRRCVAECAVLQNGDVVPGQLQRPEEPRVHPGQDVDLVSAQVQDLEVLQDFLVNVADPLEGVVRKEEGVELGQDWPVVRNLELKSKSGNKIKFHLCLI